MSEYQLELKQIVNYPRCRIYRQFVQMLLKETDIRVNGTSGLFYYTVLCCYANFRTSYKRIEGIGYTIRPGEWLCKVSELSAWFRTRFQHQAIGILQELQDKHLIDYTVLGRGQLIKYSVNGWNRHNRVLDLDYNAPCQKETGFFFLPISTAHELIGSGRCSEMDALLDLWINTVYNDKQVQGSEAGPVVYLRNGTGNPLLGYADLAQRWDISKSTASRYLKKLCERDYLTILSFPGTHGSAIYMCGYLSTMFEISDVLVDKEEVAMALNIHLDLPDPVAENDELSAEIRVSKCFSGVSKSYIAAVVQKVSKLLETQGIMCGSCSQIQYKLLPLSTDCKEVYIVSPIIPPLETLRFLLILSCNGKDELFRFEVKLIKGGAL